MRGSICSQSDFAQQSANASAHTECKGERIGFAQRTCCIQESCKMEFRDYYQILGVSKTADADEIKKAFRKLARKYHPDVSKEADAGARMTELNEANTVLSDPEKRAAYDALGARPQGGQDFRPPPDWNAGREYSGGGMSDAEAAGFSDFFSNLFGESAHRGSGTGGGPVRPARWPAGARCAGGRSTRQCRRGEWPICGYG